MPRGSADWRRIPICNSPCITVITRRQRNRRAPVCAWNSAGTCLGPTASRITSCAMSRVQRVENERIAAERQRLEPFRSQLRQQWELDDRAVILVFAGKFIEKKRPMDFVQALELADRQGATVQGLMVGDGPLRAPCEEFVRAHHI